MLIVDPAAAEVAGRAISDTARHRTSRGDAAKLPRIMEHCSRMLARPALQEAGLPKTHKSIRGGQIANPELQGRRMTGTTVRSFYPLPNVPARASRHGVSIMAENFRHSWRGSSRTPKTRRSR